MLTKVKFLLVLGLVFGGLTQADEICLTCQHKPSGYFAPEGAAVILDGKPAHIRGGIAVLDSAPVKYEKIKAPVLEESPLAEVVELPPKHVPEKPIQVSSPRAELLPDAVFAAAKPEHVSVPAVLYGTLYDARGKTYTAVCQNGKIAIAPCDPLAQPSGLFSRASSNDVDFLFGPEHRTFKSIAGDPGAVIAVFGAAPAESEPGQK